MVINIVNTLTLDKRAIKLMLLKIFETKPEFPIENLETLTNALGGKDQLLFVNENIGELFASVLAEKIMAKAISVSEPNEIIDSLIGDSFINIITKVKFLDRIENLKYPIDNKSQLLEEIKDLNLYGIPIETISEKVDYPIEKPDQILNHMKLIDKRLLDSNLELISNLEESEEEILEVDERIQTDEVTITIQNILNDDEKGIREKVRMIIEEGKNAYREKRYEEALKIYEMGLQLDSDNSQLKFFRNSVQQKIKDLQKSEELKEPTEKITDDISTEEEQQSQKTEIPINASEITTETVELAPDSELEPLSEPEPESEFEREIDLETESQTEHATIRESSKPMEQESDNDLEKQENESLKGVAQVQTLKLDNKIEELGKRLQEKVSRLKDLAVLNKDLPENACKSCEGKGVCYWCKGTGKCSKCQEKVNDEQTNECESCNGSGICHSCNGSGKCQWCNGTGLKKS